jgi:formate hydrogenlyase subunit 3/multisubunit Na+/H+ antiporter MnhD subunit
MPLVFTAAVVFALSISGIPPLNGFASKWLLYQGTLLGLGATSSPFIRGVFIFALVSAMFGSALTLASFIKLIHAVFLGEGEEETAARPAAVALYEELGACIPLSALAPQRRGSSHFFGFRWE